MKKFTAQNIRPLENDESSTGANDIAPVAKDSSILDQSSFLNAALTSYAMTDELVDYEFRESRKEFEDY